MTLVQEQGGLFMSISKAWPLYLLILVGTHSSVMASAILTGQNRLVEVYAESGSPDSDANSSAQAGVFDEEVSASSSSVHCVPFGGQCVTYRADASADQDSIIAVDNGGTLEIRSTGSTTTHTVWSGEAIARSQFSASFTLDEQTEFLLDANGTELSSVVLTSSAGIVFEYLNLAAGVRELGMLASGMYTLLIETDTYRSGNTSVLSSSYDVRFSAEPSNVQPGPRCEARMSQSGYSYGDVVTAETLRIENPGGETVPVELKIWLELTDGRRVSVHNNGADGSVGIPAGANVDYGPLTILGVDFDTEHGLYKFGCRLLDPASGNEHYESTAVFEIQ